MDRVHLSQEDGFRSMSLPAEQSREPMSVRPTPQASPQPGPGPTGDTHIEEIAEDGSPREGYGDEYSTLLNPEKCRVPLARASESDPGFHNDQDHPQQQYNEPQESPRASPGSSPSNGFHSQDEEKMFLLSRLSRLPGKYKTRRLTPHHTLEEIRSEWQRANFDMDFEEDNKFMQSGLWFLVKAMETGNSFLNPWSQSLRLDGWSDRFGVDMKSGVYDRVLEKLYVKHREKFRLSPEVELMRMIFWSGFMHHMSKGLAEDVQSKLADPEFMSAVMQTFQQRAQQAQGAPQPQSTPHPTPSGADDQPAMAGPADDFSPFTFEQPPAPIISRGDIEELPPPIHRERDDDHESAHSGMSFSTAGGEIRLSTGKGKGKKRTVHF